MPSPNSFVPSHQSISVISKSSVDWHAKLKVLGGDVVRKLKPYIPDWEVFVETVMDAPVVREAVVGCEVLQDWSTAREALFEFEQKLTRLLRTIESKQNEPGYMNPTMTVFRDNLEVLLVRVHVEAKRKRHISRLENAQRLLELIHKYEQLAAALVEEALGYGVVREVALPEEYDQIIPSLKSFRRDNGLVITAHVRTLTIDGEPLTSGAYTPELLVAVYRGTYKGLPVEIKEFFGGSEDELLQEVKELVEGYQKFKNDPYVRALLGGSADRRSDGQLCCILVFTQDEGECWYEVAQTQRSAEFLCKMAEEARKAFDHLTLKGQTNWESIKIRPDGTILINLSTRGDKFLLTENVWDDAKVPKDSSWPMRELFELFREADLQGLTRNAIACIRAHTGEWDNLAVWKIAQSIGLRPASERYTVSAYPDERWTLYPGTIFELSPERLDWLDVMPKHGFHMFELERIGRFCMTSCMTFRGNNDPNPIRSSGKEQLFTHTCDGEWEYFPLEPWENLEKISLFYECPAIGMVPWDEWTDILESCAERRGRDVEALSIVTRLDVLMTLRKEYCPELGTRPIYFYRKLDRNTATPREFWGFFSFNPDPDGPPGISVRCSHDGRGRVVSDSVPLEPAGWTTEHTEVEFGVTWVNMLHDWDYRIRDELGDRRLSRSSSSGQQNTVCDEDVEMSERRQIPRLSP